VEIAAGPSSNSTSVEAGRSEELFYYLGIWALVRSRKRGIETFFSVQDTIHRLLHGGGWSSGVT